jgi:single-stranded-DNA-specific exonuclease
MTTSTIKCRTVEQSFDTTLPPLLAQIYASRGIQSDDEVNLNLNALISPFTMGSMLKTAHLVIDAIDNQKKIIIAGDYDCDGATGTTVAVRGLSMLGAKSVRFILPDRFKHGYGLSPALVNEIPHNIDLIITVDSGVSSIEGVARAKQLGKTVIITDHHLPGEHLPDADAIINPNLKNDPFPSKALAGVGVMFYLLIAIRSIMRDRGDYQQKKEPNLAELLDIVAIGTIADLVTLDRNNRILIAAGLNRIRSGKSHAGIYALLKAANKNYQTLSASDVGFGIAPRLNAAGRLENMSLGVETLLSDDDVQAEINVGLLSTINDERKQIQANMTELAERMVVSSDSIHSMGVVVFDPTWHSGVVGLVASKIKDTLHRPTFAFAPSVEGSSELRGSGRSIPGFHLRDALALLDAQYPGMILKFGGHAMAAGMSIHRNQLDTFVKHFDNVVNSTISSECLTNTIFTDGELPTGMITLETAHMLRMAGPWGQGFPEPTFQNEFVVDTHRVLGGRHLKMVLIDPRDGAFIDAIMFFADNYIPPPMKVRLVYELSINEWQGVESVQLLVRHIEKIQ